MSDSDVDDVVAVLREAQRQRVCKLNLCYMIVIKYWNEKNDSLNSRNLL